MFESTYASKEMALDRLYTLINVVEQSEANKQVINIVHQLVCSFYHMKRCCTDFTLPIIVCL